jgi:hypothetical protein
VLQHAGDAVEKHFRANEAGIRESRRLVRQMLAAAEADFEANCLWGMREKLAKVCRCGLGEVEPQLRQQLFMERLLRLSQRLCLAPAKKCLSRPFGAAGAFIFVSACVHVRAGQAGTTAAVPCLTASLSALARSVFSHENEPSRPALRPKCP